MAPGVYRGPGGQGQGEGRALGPRNYLYYLGSVAEKWCLCGFRLRDFNHTLGYSNTLGVTGHN